MDFRRLSRLQAPDLTNSTGSVNLTTLPSNILDALVPGYSLISQYINAAFGIDISLFVSIAVLAFALTKGAQYFSKRLTAVGRYFFVSSVYIDEHDDLFDMLMDWLATTHASSSRRSVRAKTQRTNEELAGPADEALDSEGMFDYNRWSARTPPRYEPYYGRHILWHNGWPLFLHRSQKRSVGQSVSVRFGNSSEDDIIQLDCLGRSVEPIRDLLRTVKLWSLQRSRNTTTIRHPTPKDRARFSGSWSKTFSRPSRPMETVILDSEQKSMIVNDMNEYLHPSSPKWYALRGIPYRRGYLFHGPPGTGKTSLSFALAGIFGLEIYVISLQEPTLTEGDLMQLFNGLPKRCIVLLEDVDAAGLVRDRGSDTSQGNESNKSKRTRTQHKETADASKDAQENSKDPKTAQESEYTLKDLARELKSISTPRGGGNDRPSGNSNRKDGQGISLSGLLNAIDGVASHEGRVLIMTTNHPQKLDAALVRPGRVDRRVQFGLAKKAQIEELFYRMYVSGDGNIPTKPVLNGNLVSSAEVTSNGHMNDRKPNGHASKEGPDSKIAKSESSLEQLAAEFASHIPDDTFTPAEIQNHLMRYKNEPTRALETVEDWMKEVEDVKEQTAEQQMDAEDQ